jgi:N-acetylmuramic acid 6-phosphate etherase
MAYPLIPDASLGTESLHPAHAELDRYPTPQLLSAFVDDQAQAALAVQRALPELARAVDEAASRLARGGRLIYAGAGTSGRLGVLDSVELSPTFSWPAERAIGLMAGGREAMFQAVEGAEDDDERGRMDLLALEPRAADVVLLIAASGGTPYTCGVLEAARATGCLSVSLVNNPGTTLAQRADIAIVLDTGPEVISGSTRLKAGTAQKIALNALSSSLMVRQHKVYGHLMVDVRASNAKLRQRALRLVMAATGASPEQAAGALDATQASVKTAIVMLRLAVGPEQARERLAACHGDVRRALG